MTSPSAKVRSRGEQFTPNLGTKITQEVASADNPYQIEQMRIHGYDHADLIDRCEVSDVIFLLFRGNLPTDQERELLRELFIAMINPGPRHPATQASITAGVGKTLTVNILPIALSIFGGEFEGAATIEDAMRFFRSHSRQSAEACLNNWQSAGQTELPGFGQLYGDPDAYAEKLLTQFSGKHCTQILTWVQQLHLALKPLGIGIHKSGLCAAILADLGFQPRQGNSLMQLFAAPGLLAHGIEYANKPLTSMLFEPDENYVIETDNIKAPQQTYREAITL